MARPNKKSIYERIESKKDEILNKEKELAELNNELQDLFEEQKQEEMERLFAKMRENGLDIELALQKLSSQYAQDNMQDNTQDESKTRRKRNATVDKTEPISLEINEETDNITE